MRLALLAVLTAFGAGEPDVRYLDASLEPDGVVLGVEFVDVDLDGRDELCLALRTGTGERELRVYRVENDGIPAEPLNVVQVLDDALAYGFADVREEAGRELLFMTRGGVWSYSLQLEGYRGNVKRLVEAELVYDVPDPKALPYWEYAFTGARGPWLLLPGRESYAVWSGEEADEPVAEPVVAVYRRGAGFDRVEAAVDPRVQRARRERRNTEVRMGPGGVQVVRGEQLLGGLLLEEGEPGSGSLLAASRSYRAPAVVDIDGDGDLDLITSDDEELRVHLADAEGRLPEEPSRVEPLPDYLKKEDASLSIELTDLDADGDPDLLAVLREDPDGLDNDDVNLILLLNDGERLLPEIPSQLLRFQSAEMRVAVTDVDGDGIPDLSVREFELPSMLDAITGLEFTLTYLLFLGERGGERPFQRRPVLKQSETFDETTVQDAIKNRELVMDCDGDGIADMVEVDIEGRIAIRRVLHEKSFFGGESWTLEESPWLRFDSFANIESVDVRDLNDDGLGDVISVGRDSVTILLSSAGGRR